MKFALPFILALTSLPNAAFAANLGACQDAAVQAVKRALESDQAFLQKRREAQGLAATVVVREPTFVDVDPRRQLFGATISYGTSAEAEEKLSQGRYFVQVNSVVRGLQSACTLAQATKSAFPVTAKVAEPCKSEVLKKVKEAAVNNARFVSDQRAAVAAGGDLIIVGATVTSTRKINPTEQDVAVRVYYADSREDLASNFKSFDVTAHARQVALSGANGCAVTNISQ